MWWSAKSARRSRLFYNGVEQKTEKRILRLSEAFEVATEDPELELKVMVLNINPEKNEDLKNKKM